MVMTMFHPMLLRGFSDNTLSVLTRGDAVPQASLETYSISGRGLLISSWALHGVPNSNTLSVGGRANLIIS